MENITQILSKYDTDKELFHKYGSTYETIFSRYSREEPLNILEIGTQKGGSLLAWKEYFPNATVYGVDIVDVVSDEYRTDTVTRIISDVKRWDNDMEWDIVIDDGSHHLMDLVYVITNYCVKIKPNGVLVIEDVRYPLLLLHVIEDLLLDISLVFPNRKDDGYGFNIRSFDTSSPESPGSFIIAMFKEKL